MMAQAYVPLYFSRAVFSLVGGVIILKEDFLIWNL
jgi:hypothetical protein